MRKMGKLNERQRELVVEHKRYIESIAWKWIKSRKQVEHAEDLLSLAYYFLVRSAFRYEDERIPFTSYIAGGIKFMQRYMQQYINAYYMVTGIKSNGGFTRRVEMPDYFFEEYVEADPQLYREEDFDRILSLSKLLKARERKVLREVFIEEKSFSDIGRENGVSREYIRQIYNSAIKKLKKVVKFD